MNNFNWWMGILVFFFYIIIDGLYVLYTRYIQKNRPIASATVGSSMYGLYAFGTIAIIQSAWNILFIILGAWVGTYLAVKYIK